MQTFQEQLTISIKKQWQLRIGSKMFPEFPCRSMAETVYHLQRAFGIHGSAFHSLSITPAQYRNDHFIVRVDTEKIREAGFTGLNTTVGDLMVVGGKGYNANMDAWAHRSTSSSTRIRYSKFAIPVVKCLISLIFH
jgi:hypothetical protein